MRPVKESVNRGLRRTTGYQLTRKRAPARADDELKAQVRRLRRRLAKADQRKARGRRGRGIPAESAAQVLDQLRQTPPEFLGLTDIANLAGSDKGTIGPSPKWPGNNYTDVYEACFAPLRDEPVNILEVGLGVPGEAWDARIAHGRNEGGGASMRMWYDYFPNARIVGADINPAPHLDNDRITTFVLDQGDEQAIAEFLDSVGDVEFDLIIDDGSHRPDHQQVTLGCLFPRLRAGGIYIIEDLLQNGKGDAKRNRMSSDRVLNTRRVLKHFRRHGTFEEPHAVVRPDYVAEHIACLSFHVPRHRWAPDSEAVCVIRKR